MGDLAMRQIIITIIIIFSFIGLENKIGDFAYQYINLNLNLNK